MRTSLLLGHGRRSKMVFPAPRWLLCLFLALCCAVPISSPVLCLFPGPGGCACFQAISSLPRWLLCLFLARDACACFQPFPVLCCAYSTPGQIRHNLVSASPTIRPTWQAPTIPDRIFMEHK